MQATPFIGREREVAAILDRLHQLYVRLPTEAKVQMSMDGRGRAVDNVFTEQLWWSIKYEEVYLNDYQSPAEAR